MHAERPKTEMRVYKGRGFSSEETGNGGEREEVAGVQAAAIGKQRNER